MSNEKRIDGAYVVKRLSNVDRFQQNLKLVTVAKLQEASSHSFPLWSYFIDFSGPIFFFEKRLWQAKIHYCGAEDFEKSNFGIN